ncbi:MAG: FAD-dependent oxidoreductase [Nitriliruptoraceae bacterium]|nr:FAD-dependent oxidoreductase [Nitriliruptoraceae bacterium]
MTNVIIIGAGMSGLFAGHALRAAGLEVLLLDKGFAPGGRVATRTLEGRTFDHGAQFLTAKTPRFQGFVDAWCAEGIARQWFHGSPDADRPGDPDGYPRYRGVPTMRRIPEFLAVGLDLRLGAIVSEVTTVEGRAQVRWEVRCDGRQPTRPTPPPGERTASADAVLLTAPVPQSLALLDAGAVRLDATTQQTLAAVTYDPCIAVLAVPHGAPALPARGAVRVPGAEVEWVSDHLVTGASARPGVTLHASPALSRALWDEPDDVVGRRILERAATTLGTDAELCHIHRWRYSNPTSRASGDSLLDVVDGVPVAFAGDALAGGRIEGAATSGLDAAARLIAALTD